jgi:hypothetical protein
MEEQPTPEQVIDAVKGGEFDGHLVDLIDAVRARFQHGSTEQKWKVDYQGETITQDSLTLDEAALVERYGGTSWASINPAGSAAQCRAILAAYIARGGVPFAEALKVAGAVSLADVEDAVGTYEVVRAPKGLAA